MTEADPWFCGIAGVYLLPGTTASRAVQILPALLSLRSIAKPRGKAKATVRLYRTSASLDLGAYHRRKPVHYMVVLPSTVPKSTCGELTQAYQVCSNEAIQECLP